MWKQIECYGHLHVAIWLKWWRSIKASLAHRLCGGARALFCNVVQAVSRVCSCLFPSLLSLPVRSCCRAYIVTCGSQFFGWPLEVAADLWLQGCCLWMLYLRFAHGIFFRLCWLLAAAASPDYVQSRCEHSLVDCRCCCSPSACLLRLSRAVCVVLRVFALLGNFAILFGSSICLDM